MIGIEFHDGQGLGNQLWVYAAARSIAEQLRVPFTTIGAERFKGREFLDIVYDDLESSLFSITNDRVLCEFNEINFFDNELKHLSSDFDERVLSITRPTILNGLFQSEKYFFGEKERPKRYVKLKPQHQNTFSLERGVCVLNIRGGEYKRHRNLILPKRYWLDAMVNMMKLTRVDKFVIVTDDPAYAKALLPNIEILPTSIATSYITLYQAHSVIVSNSSFSYFPIKTSNIDKVVIAPRFWGRHNSPKKRWASPANLYCDWFYQDPGGLLVTAEECLSECEQVITEYESQYCVRTTKNYAQPQPIRQFVPKSVRQTIKRTLGKIFPLHIG